MAAMAFVAATDSTVRVDDYPPSSFRKVITGVLTMSGGEGQAADDIPASLFGLTKIEGARPLVKSDDSIIVVVAPAYSGGSLLGKAAATAAAADVPAGDYRAVIYGY